MSGNVESMFSVRQMPGTAKAPRGHLPGSWAEARTLAGLDWDPVTTAVYAITGIHPTAPTIRARPGRKSISRSDTGAVLSLNKDTYTVIDHRRDGRDRRGGPGPAPTSNGKPRASWTAAGRLVPWPCSMSPSPCRAMIPDPADLAITNRHDGTAACALRATAVRIVCANTFRAAELEGERTGTTFSFIHKSSWRNRIDEARKAVTGARVEMRRYADLARDLLAIPVTPAQRELFITEFIPKPPEGLITDRVVRNVDEARAALRMIFETKTTEHVADTAYGLVQAAGEYLDHVRTARSWETRLNRTLIRPEPLKHRALSLARDIITT